MLFSGQGPVNFALRDPATGNNGKRFDMGCLDKLDLAFSLDQWKKKEACSGQRLDVASGIKGKSATASAEASEFRVAVFEQLTLGTSHTISGDKTGSVTAETIFGLIDVGDVYETKRAGITTVVITDSTPVTPLVVANTKYDVTGPTGKIAFNATFNAVGYVFPLKVAYTYSEPSYVSLFTRGLIGVNLRYRYLNTQNSDAPGLVELYNVNINPLTALPLINDEYASFPFTMDVLADPTKPAGGVLGQFGRIVDATLI